MRRHRPHVAALLARYRAEQAENPWPLPGRDAYGLTPEQAAAPCSCGHRRDAHLNGGDFCKAGGVNEPGGPRCSCHGWDPW